MQGSHPKVLLDMIASEVRACHLCPLAVGRTNAVPGVGPPSAEIVLVGEGPGRAEDQAGEPFVGRAGKLLDSVLRSIGVKREEVFITNVVKCRPPNNRPPTRAEMETCTNAYLFRQIELIAPRKVVLLGRTASKAVLQIDTLKEARTKVVRRDRVSYHSTYHPAAVLRNPRLQRKLRADLRKSFGEG